MKKRTGLASVLPFAFCVDEFGNVAAKNRGDEGSFLGKGVFRIVRRTFDVVWDIATSPCLSFVFNVFQPKAPMLSHHYHYGKPYP